MFAQRFSSTRRGAHLARLLAVQQLAAWRVPYGSPLSDTVALLVGELAANAVTHGHVPGRDFELRLRRGADLLRVEVSDTHTDRFPPAPEALRAPGPEAESGHGLLLVDTFAQRWGVVSRAPAPGKTVWAEVSRPLR